MRRDFKTRREEAKQMDRDKKRRRVFVATAVFLLLGGWWWSANRTPRIGTDSPSAAAPLLVRLFGLGSLSRSTH